MAKQDNKPTTDKENGNTNPKVGNEIPLKTEKAAPYPQAGVKPDQQSERFEPLRKKFPNLIDSDFSGERATVLQRLSQRTGATVGDLERMLVE